MLSKRFLTGLFVCGAIFTPIFVSAANSDVAISQILFDPDGADSGFEYVVLKNFGSTNATVSGWDLYPDGIGYFTFPSFTLGAGTEVKIHLRTNGFADQENLYHASPATNISNSSGSLALFSSNTHSKDTIVSFVRYHKPGSTERKTWETTAASAGMWTVGAFFDISSGAEGKILTLSDFNNRAHSSGWTLQATTTPVSASSSTATSSTTSTASSNLPSDNLVSGSIPDPQTYGKIKAYAGKDRTVLVGEEVDFEGSAEGLTGEPLKSARFLWNFGDGEIAEGKITSHYFLYPGVYTVSANVSLAEFGGVDRVKITAMNNPLTISEIKPGESGWLEIKNISSKTLDISHFVIAEGDHKFIFSKDTFVSPDAFLVVSKKAMGFSLPDSGELKLMYSTGAAFVSAKYDAPSLGEGESISLINHEWVKTKATPGEKNSGFFAANPGSSKNPEFFSPNHAKKVAKIKVPKEIKTENATSSDIKENLTASVSDTNRGDAFSWGEYSWLLGGLGVGILGGILFLFIKKKIL